MKPSTTFTIQYEQLINPAGELVSELPDFAKKKEHLIDFYREMLLIRRLDEKALALQRTGKIGTYPGHTGQEAFTVGIGHAIEKSDVFVPYYRDVGTLIHRGMSLFHVLAYWGGDERGSDFPECREDFPIAIPVSSQTLHAAGIAYAIKFRKEKRAVLVTLGDGATSEGDFYEAMNFAGVFKLPVVFVINNNQWAISVSRKQQTASETLAQKAIAAGLSGIQVDGNDVIAVTHVVKEALKKARDGNQPAVIEAVTYRLCDHTTVDDAKRYVPAGENRKAWECEPLARLKKYLKNQSLISDDLENSLKEACNQLINEAVETYLKLSPQPLEAMIDYLYEELPTTLKSQRKEIGELDHD